ncbi:sigma factor [Streptomyces sp. TG1A-8]|uniref:sigma factor n=1 Tax=Streptomyces sp. TG1A-8 TaxID=3051385 RepID=UPI00265C50D3|nr:sigma factor [Streptomyces sp. TG1A-8]MDO0926804.1 sigma factor [Streptomyces sp. TG1A-8]
MIDLTAQQIAAAQNNDLTAVTAVIEATEERVIQLARRYATTGGRTDADLMNDLAQVGRVAVWEGLSRFTGSSVAEFFTFMDRTVSGKLSDERKTVTRQGVSRSIAAEFEKALSMAAGDPYEAERLCTLTEVMGTKRMTAETAYAARISWQGAEYLDAPVGENENATVADTLTNYAIARNEANDELSDRQRENKRRVHETLDLLPAEQEAILSAEYGIGDFPCVGADDYRGLAEVAGISYTAVESVRDEARKNFKTLYLGGSPEAPKGETQCCKACGIEKPVDEFYVRNKVTGARMTQCKSCKRGATKRFRKDNPEKRAEQKRAYNARKKAAAA